jgi:hypothetical protein
MPGYAAIRTTSCVRQYQSKEHSMNTSGHARIDTNAIPGRPHDHATACVSDESDTRGFGGLAGGIEGRDGLTRLGGLAGGIGGDSLARPAVLLPSIVIPQWIGEEIPTRRPTGT